MPVFFSVIFYDKLVFAAVPAVVCRGGGYQIPVPLREP